MAIESGLSPLPYMLRGGEGEAGRSVLEEEVEHRIADQAEDQIV